MRHNNKLKKLGRNSSHRKALISNMMKSLIRHEKVITTTAKAKALRPFIEKLITKAKNDTMHNRRTVYSKLQHNGATIKLFDDIAKRYVNRPGGYTRILKLNNRKGDNAPLSLIEFVEEEMTSSKKNVKKSEKKASKQEVTATAIDTPIEDSTEENNTPSETVSANDDSKAEDVVNENSSTLDKEEDPKK